MYCDCGQMTFPQEAIANMMNNLLECKAAINSGQAKISNLNDDLLEHEKELQNATAKIEELVSCVINSTMLAT